LSSSKKSALTLAMPAHRQGEKNNSDKHHKNQKLLFFFWVFGGQGERKRWGRGAWKGGNTRGRARKANRPRASHRCGD